LRWVCLFVCLSACLSLSARITRKPYGQTSFLCVLLVGCGRGLVLLWQHCDALFTSGFVDDVMFSYHGANGPESSTTLCSEEVRQVAVPVGRQDNYSVWSSSSESGTGGEIRSLCSMIDVCSRYIWCLSLIFTDNSSSPDQAIGPCPLLCVCEKSYEEVQ